eukprot:6187771-Pleurochrysis_carterae.AAC.5
MGVRLRRSHLNVGMVARLVRRKAFACEYAAARALLFACVRILACSRTRAALRSLLFIRAALWACSELDERIGEGWDDLLGDVGMRLLAVGQRVDERLGEEELELGEGGGGSGRAVAHVARR